MSMISGVNQALVDTQLQSLQLRQQIDTSIAAKTLDHARQQGQAALKLLDAALDVARPDTQPTMAAKVTGLGQNLDCSG